MKICLPVLSFKISTYQIFYDYMDQAFEADRLYSLFLFLFLEKPHSTLGLYTTRNEAIVRFARVCCLKHKGGLAVIKGISK